MSFQNDVATRLGTAFRRSAEVPFGIRTADRLSHIYVIGQTGTGKSTLLQNMVLQDAAQGAGYCLIDPHGDLAGALVEALPEALYWRVGDQTSPFGYNPLPSVPRQLRPLVTSALIETLRAQWAEAWGVRMEHLLRFAVLGLLDKPKATLRDILPLFTDKAAREAMLDHIVDDEVRRFWTEEWPGMNYKTAIDGVAPIANKLGGFLAHPVLRHSLTEPETPIRFRQFMERGHGLIVDLGKGRIGSDLANITGGLLVSSLVHAAFSRTDTTAGKRKPFHLYVDEFHNFTTATIANLLSETRKFGLSVTLAQQYTAQGKPEVQASVFGNAGTLISFRIGADDAPSIARQLSHPRIDDLIRLPNHSALIRLMIDGQPSHAFSMRTLPPK